MSHLPGVRDAYGGAAAAWAAGPAPLYRRMADTLVTATRIVWRGLRVLDVGAGSGATSAALTDAGARVTATDVSHSMLSVERVARPPSAVADAAHLPVRPRAFDASVAAFVLSHVEDPVDVLHEMGRVVTAGGWVVTLGYDARWSHPARQRVEAVARRFGWERPPWYERLKTELEPRTGYPGRLAEAAVGAGLRDVDVLERAADTGVQDPADLVAWRLGLPMCTAFVAGLDPLRREQLVREAIAAVGSDPEPLAPHVLLLVARVA